MHIQVRLDAGLAEHTERRSTQKGETQIEKQGNIWYEKKTGKYNRGISDPVCSISPSVFLEHLLRKP